MINKIYFDRLINTIHDMELPYLRVCLTSFCNAYCYICHNEGQEKASSGGLSLHEYDEVAKLLAPHFHPPRVVLTGGEPLLFHDLYEVIKIFKSYKYTVGLVTNGILLDEHTQKKLLESGLDTINISLNSLDREKHQNFYGIDEFIILKKNLEVLDKHFMYPQKKINWVISDNPVFDDEIQKLCVLSQKYKFVISLMFDVNIDSEKTNSLFNRIKKILYNNYGEPSIEKHIKYKRYIEHLKFNNGSIWEFDYLQTEQNKHLLKNNVFCRNCHSENKEICYEGAYALRLFANGIFKPCLIRKDNEVKISDIFPKSNIELEVKYKVLDFPTKLIESLGFVELKRSHQVDKYHIVNKILNGKRTYMRLRNDVINNKMSFDFHQVISDIAIEETEIALNDSDDIDIMGTILEKLNYPFVCEVDKYRMVYRNGDIELVLDTVKNLGKFIEIELTGDEEHESHENLFQLVTKLSLNEKDRIIKKGYPDMILSE
ncbi:MAG: radical SAM protein [Oscillospiraceae bacterium]|nr:radical SAM protein [Oscillospiraceae bacterium]